MAWAWLVAATGVADGRDWTGEVIYFAMADRFLDGDPANNVPEGSDPRLFDPAQRDIARYMGGDLRGLEKAVASGYFEGLGVSALWLTPVVRNVWRSGYDLGGWKSGYHGYWTQDWLDIDPHLTSRTALDGKPYENSAEGRMRHYRDFVDLAHQHGLRVIQDVVLNHAGPVFYYDSDGDGSFDFDREDEWVRPFQRDGYHGNARWAEIAQWNARRTMPDGPRELLGHHIATRGILSRLEAYGRKGFSGDSLGKRDGEEVMCDFFSLRDLWTDPTGAHFDELVDEFVEIYWFYLEKVGVDGLRIDTVKHVHHGFWDAFTERLRKRLGDSAREKLLFGEIYDGDPAVLGRYTWRSDWPARKDPCLDAVLDFRFCFAAREYLRHGGSGFGTAQALEKALVGRTANDAAVGRPFYNPNPGPDGRNARDKMITFIENHDGLNRFRVDGVTAERNRLAQALVMSLPGIPCLYYGTETDLHDRAGKLGEDGETGRMMFFRKDGGPSLAEVRGASSYQSIARLAALRREHEVLRTGDFVPLWVDGGGPEDDGVFAFARVSADGNEFVVVAMNVADSPRRTTTSGITMRLPNSIDTAGRNLKPLLVVGRDGATCTQVLPASGPLDFELPPSSLVVFGATEPKVQGE